MRLVGPGLVGGRYSMSLPELVAEFVAAKDARIKVCYGDCEWPRGDGECGYCARERIALRELLTEVGAS